jgi:2-hydroxychromene-2-carboxylate isomerase
MSAIDYYYWINSDWAYLGADRLRAIARRHGAVIQYKPVRLLEVYARTGGIPLGKRSPERQNYRVAELRRWCAYLGVHVNPQPKYLCPDDELASSMVIAALRQHLDVHELSNAIFRAEWVHDRDISDSTVLLGAAKECGLDGARLLDTANSPEVKAELVHNTEEAISRGVFGSPAYFVGGEHFWGQDRLDWVDRILSETQTGNR